MGDFCCWQNVFRNAPTSPLSHLPTKEIRTRRRGAKRRKRKLLLPRGSPKIRRVMQKLLVIDFWNLVEVVMPFVVIHSNRFLKKVCYVSTDGYAEKKLLITFRLKVVKISCLPICSTISNFSQSALSEIQLTKFLFT